MTPDKFNAVANANRKVVDIAFADMVKDAILEAFSGKIPEPKTIIELVPCCYCKNIPTHVNSEVAGHGCSDYQVVCSCGMHGPYGYDEDDARNEWNKKMG